MKNLVKSFIVLAITSIIVVSCQDEITVNENTTAAKKAADKISARVATIDLGLPGGIDPVDADGNVTVSRNLTLTSGNTYILHNYFRIQDGFTITIEPGVEIQGAGPGETAGDIVTSALVIERGAKIEAQGTQDSPIVFTSNNPVGSRNPGNWGGVVILGNAPVNIKANPSIPTTDGVGTIEGLPNPNNTGFYGGTDANDNSGTLRYVRIEYAGNIIGTANELNGLTLGGVGAGTTIDHVQVSFGLDDGFEFFGGTVNCKYLVANRNGDDDLDTDQGYSGKIQFALVIRDQNGSWLADFPLNGNESNGDIDDSFNNNLTSAQFSNVTFIGPYVNNCSGTVNANYSSGIYLRDDSKEDFFNSVIIGFPNGIRLNKKTALANFNTSATLDPNKIDIKNTSVFVPANFGGTATRGTLDDNTGTNFDNAFFTSTLNNTIKTATLCAGDNFVPNQNLAGISGLSPFAWRGILNQQPDAVPFHPIGGLIGTASFTGLDPFFDIVNYRGAFAPAAPNSTNWLNGWTAWQF